MSEVTDLIYAPGDNLKKFNREIQRACSEVPVTHFEATLVKGGGVKVTLWTDYTEADEEDVKADDSGEIKEGEAITEGPPCCAFLAITSVENAEQRSLTNDRLEKLAELCQASVVEDINLYGEDYAWVGSPEETNASPMYLPVKFSYTLRVFEIQATTLEEEEEEEVRPSSEDDSEAASTTEKTSTTKAKKAKKAKKTKPTNSNKNKNKDDDRRSAQA